jgi:DNA-binding NarL/FixJ family response regulator
VLQREQGEWRIVRRQHVVQGVETGGVARALWVTEYTVNDHLKAIFAKVGVRSRLELAAAIA